MLTLSHLSNSRSASRKPRRNQISLPILPILMVTFSLSTLAMQEMQGSRRPNGGASPQVENPGIEGTQSHQSGQNRSTPESPNAKAPTLRKVIQVPDGLPDTYLVRLNHCAEEVDTTVHRLVASHGGQVITTLHNNRAFLFRGSVTNADWMVNDRCIEYVAEYDGGPILEGNTEYPGSSNSQDVFSARYFADSVLTRVEASTSDGSSSQVAAQKSANDADFIRRMMAAHRYARSQGWVSGFPTGHCKDYPDSANAGWMRMKCGTTLINSVVAEYREVSASDLGVSGDPEIGSLMRGANDYAARMRLGAYPTFEKHIRGDGVTSYSVILLKYPSIEWRDVPVSELPPTRFENWRQRLRDIFLYAQARGFVAAIPNGHQANNGVGVVYGTFFFKFGPAIFEDVTGVIYGEPDRFVDPTYNGAVPVLLRRHESSYGAWSCSEPGTIVADTSFFCGDVNDPVYSRTLKSRAHITNVANTSGLSLRVWYIDRLGRRSEGVDLGLNQYTSAFNGKELGGKFVVKLNQFVSGLSPDQTIWIEINYSGPAEEGSGPTPFPQPLTAPSKSMFYRLASDATNKVVDQSAPCSIGNVTVGRGSVGGWRQVFRFIPGPNSTWYIQSLNTGMFLDVEDSQTGSRVRFTDLIGLQNGSGLSKQKIEGEPSQRFTVKHTSSGFVLSPSNAPQKALTIEGPSPVDGSSIILSDSNPPAPEFVFSLWRLEPAIDAIAYPGLMRLCR